MRGLSVKQQEDGLKKINEYVLDLYTKPNSDVIKNRIRISTLEIAKMIDYQVYIDNFDKIKAYAFGDRKVGSEFAKGKDVEDVTIQRLHSEFLTFMWVTVNRRLFKEYNIGFTRLMAFTVNNNDRLNYTLATIEECFAIRASINSMFSKMNSYLTGNKEKIDDLQGEWYFKKMPPGSKEMKRAMKKYFGKDFEKFESKNIQHTATINTQQVNNVNKQTENPTEIERFTRHLCNIIYILTMPFGDKCEPGSMNKTIQKLQKYSDMLKAMYNNSKGKENINDTNISCSAYTIISGYLDDIIKFIEFLEECDFIPKNSVNTISNEEDIRMIETLKQDNQKLYLDLCESKKTIELLKKDNDALCNNLSESKNAIEGLRKANGILNAKANLPQQPVIVHAKTISPIDDQQYNNMQDQYLLLEQKYQELKRRHKELQDKFETYLSGMHGLIDAACALNKSTDFS